MATNQFLVVIEAGLTANQYGATIVTSGPMDADSARALVGDVLAGRKEDVVRISPDAHVVKVSGADQYLVVESRRGQPDRLTRISVAEAVG